MNLNRMPRNMTDFLVDINDALASDSFSESFADDLLTEIFDSFDPDSRDAIALANLIHRLIDSL